YLTLQALDIFTFLADHNPRPRRVNDDPRLLGEPLDNHATDRGTLQTLLDERAHLEIGNQLIGVMLRICIPDRVVIPDDTQPDSNRIYFLTHTVTLPASCC